MHVSIRQWILSSIIAALLVLNYGCLLAQEPIKEPEPPKEAKEMMQFINALNELQQKINPILKDFSEKRIDKATAESKIYPLVKAQIDLEVKDIDKQLAMLRKRLEELEQLKRDPEKAIQERIRMFLDPIEQPVQK